MDNNLLIVGAGAYGYVVKETAQTMDTFDKISFVDDNCLRDDVVGKIEDIISLLSEYSYGIVAIGNPEIRKKYTCILEESGYIVATLIHPRAYVSETARIEAGCVIEPMAVVHSNAVVDKGSLICAGSVVNHNAVIGEFCQIDCNATIGAGAVVEYGTKIVSCDYRSKN